jgi:hypothetical protein
MPKKIPLRTRNHATSPTTDNCQVPSIADPSTPAEVEKGEWKYKREYRSRHDDGGGR